ncbi:hypothetical protein Agabi119p4_5917 [Agaricus bisporus var. burnettii]|uniref:Cytochrome b5 heme-binding domain-containing protein n=1 Tax=Agaricus bisporus var. burnettii TaxID=192524 RepID=A0A8H7F0V1_AGABI|nr:hypothetical protein Agabi119p4_5917 [Agaricus bisporus var. burnettii]
MASYFLNWLKSGPTSAPETGPTTATQPTNASVPTLTRHSPPPDDEGSDTETEQDHEDDDSPPSFPSLNSAQRAKSQPSSIAPPNLLPKVLTDTQLMPPPPIPTKRLLNPPRTNTPGSLAVPLTTTKKPATKKREKVALAPGHSPMDWANLKTSGQDLRGTHTLMRITPSMLKQHNKRDDAWSAINGKVYNITPYLPYHPGGEKELMRSAGRDGTKLFALTHAWVNAEMMLDACLVGFLVPEPSS